MRHVPACYVRAVAAWTEHAGDSRSGMRVAHSAARPASNVHRRRRPGSLEPHRHVGNTRTLRPCSYCMDRACGEIRLVYGDRRDRPFASGALGPARSRSQPARAAAPDPPNRIGKPQTAAWSGHATAARPDHAAESRMGMRTAGGGSQARGSPPFPSGINSMPAPKRSGRGRFPAQLWGSRKSPPRGTDSAPTIPPRCPPRSGADSRHANTPSSSRNRRDLAGRPVCRPRRDDVAHRQHTHDRSAIDNDQMPEVPAHHLVRGALE